VLLGVVCWIWVLGGGFCGVLWVVMVGFGLKWVKSGGLKMGCFWGFGLGVGAFSENGGFWGFPGYKLPSVFGGGIVDFGLKILGRGILGVGVI